MRRDKMVRFVRYGGSGYDPELGREVREVLAEEERSAHVEDLRDEKTLEVFGVVRRNAKLVRIQGHLAFIPSEMELDGGTYQVLWQRVLARVTVFYGAEVEA